MKKISHKLNLIEPKLCMNNHRMVLYKDINFFVSIRNQRWLPPHSNLTYDPLEKEFQNDSYLRSQNHLNMDGMFLIYAPLQNVLMGNQRWLPLQNKMTIKGHILI